MQHGTQKKCIISTVHCSSLFVYHSNAISRVHRFGKERVTLKVPSTSVYVSLRLIGSIESTHDSCFPSKK